MRYGSLFSGIGGFDLALDRSGMEPVWQVEQDRDCNKILDRHWPGVNRRKDVRRAGRSLGAIDLVCAGWPCQGNSVAGRRAGMAHEGSGLWAEVVRILAAKRPDWFFGENVPGILSVNGGRDFGAVLRDLGQLGYGFAYRVLDAQFFGLAQRRKRVFIVGCLGDWRRAAQVLFESDCLPWDPPPSRAKKQETAGTIGSCTDGGGQRTTDLDGVAFCLNAKGGSGRIDGESETFIAHTLRAEGHDASEDGTGRGVPLVAMTLPASNGGASSGMQPVIATLDMRQCSRGETMTNNRREGSSGGAPGTGIHDAELSPTVCDSHPPAIVFNFKAGGSKAMLGIGDKPTALYASAMPAVAFQSSQSGVRQVDSHATLDSNNGSRRHNGIAYCGGVRRLTPRECARLQGFPDDWLDGLSDSAKYRCLGNAVAVPVAEWIARRIANAS